jgi:hypothetical protein
MNFPDPKLFRAAVVAALVGSSLASSAVTLGQVDTFTDGTLMNWQGASPTNAPTGGPGGAGDRFLQLQSTGTIGPGSKMATPNQFQWSGDYATAGVNVVECDMRNLGATDLSMRAVITSAGFSKYTTTVPVALPVGSGWRHVRFVLDSTNMSLIVGAESLSSVLAGVTSFQFRHTTDLTDGGQSIAATLGIDNITASAGRTVAGKISFTGTVVNAGQRSATFTFRTPGTTTAVYSLTGSVDLASKTFVVSAPPMPGTYDLAIQGAHWLRKVVHIDTTTGNVTGVDVNLVNGDCDGNNFVNTDDYLILNGAFDSAAGDPTFVAGADLDDSGFVNTDDYLILSANFDEVGAD